MSANCGYRRELVDLTGKRIIVTGASSGIGRGCAITFSKLGASVILIARREDKLRETFEMLETCGGVHSYYVADLGMLDGVEGLIKNILSEQGSIDGLLYAAGVAISVPLAAFNPERVQSEFNVNYYGFIEMVRQICKKGRYNQGLRIVGISSIASKCGDPMHTVYSASKAAMDASVRCLAKELAKKGIALNTIAPAAIQTEMFETYKIKYGEDSESLNTLLSRQYLGLGEVQDVANAAAFLLSPAARFITGICMPVDGGYTSS